MAAIQQATVGADLIIVGGGLGPTEDDISREALAEACWLSLVEDKHTLAVVRRFLIGEGHTLYSKQSKAGTGARRGQNG